MYLVIKHNFDTSKYEEIMGCADDEICAIKWINENEPKLVKYEGSDGVTYPYYTKRYINKIEGNI